MNGPLVSVIVPVYNAEQYLHACIESVLSQDCPDFELLLIDDGSSDNSKDICDAYQGKDDRIVVLHTENQGVSAARNKGIALCRSAYIMFLDADDMLLPHALRTMTTSIQASHAEIVLAGYKTDQTTINPAWPTQELLLAPSEMAEFCLCQHMDVSVGGIAAKLYDAALLSSTRFSCEHTFAEDSALNMLLFAKAKRIQVLPEVVYYYRQHEGSLSFSVAGNVSDAVNWVLEQRQAYLERYDLPNGKSRLMACHINLCIHMMNVCASRLPLQQAVSSIRQLIGSRHFRVAITDFYKDYIDTRSGLVIVGLSHLRMALTITLMLKAINKLRHQ